MPDALCPADELLAALDSRDSLFAFLHRRLSWNLDPEDTFTYTDANAVGRVAARAELSQILPFSVGDPFVIFLVEFKDRFLRTDLREILRGIRRRIKNEAAYKNADLDELVFVCTVPGGIRFARFEERDNRQPKLRVFGYDRDTVGETHTLRTLNLPALVLTRNLLGEVDWAACRKNWDDAWNVEKVTKQFFKDYKRVFETVRDTHISGVTGDKQLFTQRLFNRLMFIHFLSKKEWLTFNGRKDYLFALRDAANAANENLFHDRLYWAFFHGLGVLPGANTDNQSRLERIERRGNVPYLNGGLFEMSDEYDVRGTVTVANAAFDLIFNDLFAPYNFTVAESTPDDADVALDPEMLGKVFEELVTGRHESGSYYTPRPIVQFMCREALKGYLANACPLPSPSHPPAPSLIGMREGETSLASPADRLTASGTPSRLPLSHSDEGGGRGVGGYLMDADAIARFVDDHDPSGITNHEAVLAALKSVKVVDPACGSGAYLLGMLQELMALRLALFNAKQPDDRLAYDRKLEIIQNNLYGVDIEMFAVNTARLRLWLSLVVDQTRNPLNDPGVSVALPNLDFKIECGDSVSCPDPSKASGTTMSGNAVEAFKKAKEQHGGPRYPGDKADLKNRVIPELRVEIARWEGRDEAAFDWRVDFREVFGDANTEQESSAFDIVLANPPFVNMVEMETTDSAYRTMLRNRYTSARGGFDLFIPFMERGIQLLKQGGIFCFITPNKVLSAEYAKSLRDVFRASMTLTAITDLSNIPVFNASVYPVITMAVKAKHNKEDVVSVFHCQSRSLDETQIELVHQCKLAVLDYADNNWSVLVHPRTRIYSDVFRNCQLLGDYSAVTGAATVSEAYEWKEAVVDKGETLNKTIPSRYVPFVVSGNIRKFYNTWGVERVQYIKQSYTNPVLDLKHPVVSAKRIQQINSPKIIVSGMSKRPTSVWNAQPTAAGKSTVIVIPHNIADGAYLSAVLNSTRILSWLSSSATPRDRNLGAVS